MNLAEVAEAIRSELAEHYQTVRVSGMQNEDQFLKELKAVNPEKLPGVIIVFDGMLMNSAEAIEECRFTLVLIDRFTSGSDARALGVFQAAADLLELFPADGRSLGGVYVHPEDCVAASPDAQYAALALGIVCKQGF